MVGIVLSFISSLGVLAGLPAAAGAGATCDGDLGPARCETAPPSAGARLGAADDDGPRYATQAVVDCPAPATMWADLLGLAVGECDGTLRDASYLASRDPESERAPGSLRPGRRERSRTATWAAACDGNPSEGRDAASNPAPGQPMALFALPGLPDAPVAVFVLDASSAPRSRQLRPLERPPRS